MDGVFGDEFKELVRSRTDIVALIGETVHLQSVRGGREFVCLCPFHDDHRPSMRVYPDRQSFRCWSCNTGGDCFAFVMLHDRVDFHGALEVLAQRAHLEMPQRRGSRDRQNPDETQKHFEAMAWAESQFHDCLLRAPEAERARAYLRDRKFSEETIRLFRLGYHPNHWEWLLQRAAGKFTPAQLQAVRLVGQREGQNSYYDFFTDRVMFPIRDARSRPVAFGGRVLPGPAAEKGPKYWNSPESPYFSKSRLLYGLDRARDAICKRDTAVVVEGYTDCILCHQGGVQNVVGTLGTALTEFHVAHLKRLARKVVLVYDGDQAGRNAAERSLPKFLAQEVDLRILTLPGDLDPADYVTQFGAAAFDKLLDGATEAWEQKLRLTIEQFGLDSIDSRHRVLQGMLETLLQVSSSTRESSWTLREDVILGKLAHRLNISEKTIRSQLQQMRNRSSDPVGPPQRPVRLDAASPAQAPKTSVEALFPKQPSRDDWMERELLEVIFQAPQTVALFQAEIEPSQLRNPFLAQLLVLCYDMCHAGDEPSYSRVMSSLEDLSLKRLVTEIDEHAQSVGVSESLVPVVLDYFRRRREPHAAAPSHTESEVVSPAASDGTLTPEQVARLQQATAASRWKLAQKPLN